MPGLGGDGDSVFSGCEVVVWEDDTVLKMVGVGGLHKCADILSATQLYT